MKSKAIRVSEGETLKEGRREREREKEEGRERKRETSDG